MRVQFMRKPLLLAFAAPLFVFAACMPADRLEQPPINSGTSEVDAKEMACQLDNSLRHKTRRDGTRKVIYDGQGAIAYLSNYAVNTDGAPNSYHPDDLSGKKGLAINTICNGANATDGNGIRYNYKQCGPLIDTFRAAQAEGWTKPDGARMDFYGVATSDDAVAVPCIGQTGKYAGYLVSTTSLLADRRKGRCEQSRYLDALKTNFIIRPGSNFNSIGMELGDLAVVLNTKTGETQYAVVGDTGPSTGLGEGSVGLLQRLGNRTDVPTTRRETYGYGLKNVVTVILPGAKISGVVDQKAVDSAGEAAFSAFGGTQRLKACAKIFE